MHHDSTENYGCLQLESRKLHGGMRCELSCGHILYKKLKLTLHHRGQRSSREGSNEYNRICSAGKATGQDQPYDQWPRWQIRGLGPRSNRVNPHKLQLGFQAPGLVWTEGLLAPSSEPAAPANPVWVKRSTKNPSNSCGLGVACFSLQTRSFCRKLTFMTVPLSEG